MKKRVALLFAIGAGVGFLLARRKRFKSLVRLSPFNVPVPVPQWISNRDAVLRRYLLYFVLPLWLVPGFLDYVWHKRTKIESTSGIAESVIHLLMMAEIGVPIMAALLLEINAGVIAFMLAAYALHTLTGFVDVALAVKTRVVMPNEQHTHSYLEVLPLGGVSFIICLHWDQFLALFGQGPEAPRFKLRWKDPPLSRTYLAAINGLIVVFVALPYTEEILRCWRAARQGLIGADTPECATELFRDANVLGIK